MTPTANTGTRVGMMDHAEIKALARDYRKRPEIADADMAEDLVRLDRVEREVVPSGEGYAMLDHDEGNGMVSGAGGMDEGSHLAPAPALAQSAKAGE